MTQCFSANGEFHSYTVILYHCYIKDHLHLIKIANAQVSYCGHQTFNSISIKTTLC